MRCGIAQREQRMKLLEPELGLFALNGLRLVYNEDRIRLGEDIYRPAAAELVKLH